MDRFLGMGLKNAFALWVFVVIMTVLAKVVLNKYPVPGVTDVVNAV